ncbi:hypothetical protein EMCRGX_G018583 [Ephydatia muelleri]
MDSDCIRDSDSIYAILILQGALAVEINALGHKLKQGGRANQTVFVSVPKTPDPNSVSFHMACHNIFQCCWSGLCKPTLHVVKLVGRGPTFDEAPDGFDAVSVQNVGSTYIIVSWDLPTHSNGILINFSLYCNGALSDVLPLTVISCNTTGLLPLTLYMYMSSSHARRHCTPVGTWCWASSVLQPACPVMYMYTSRNISGKITHTIYPPSLLPPFTITSSLSLAPPVHCDSNLLSMRRTALLGDPLILSQTLMTLSSVLLLIRSLTLTSPLAPSGAYCPHTFMTPTNPQGQSKVYTTIVLSKMNTDLHLIGRYT